MNNLAFFSSTKCEKEQHWLPLRKKTLVKPRERSSVSTFNSVTFKTLEMARSWFYIIGWFPSVVAILGNALILLIIISRTRLHIPPNWFVLSLASADFAVGLVFFPIDFFCGNNSRCDIGYDIAGLAIYSSVTNLCAMTIDRYIAIVKPLRYVTWMISRRAAFLVALAWSIPLGLFFIPALCASLGKCNMKNKPFIFSRMILLEIIPCLFLLIATIQIIITARRHGRQNARLHAQLQFNQGNTRRARDFSAARVIITVVIVYLACYCVELFSVIRFLVDSSEPTSEVSNAMYFMLIVNSAANPIAYAMFKRDIRRELKTLCRPSQRSAALRHHMSTAV